MSLAIQENDALSSTSSILKNIFIGGIAMVTVEKSDPFSPESQYLIEKLSSELVAITGDSGKKISPQTQWMRTDRCGYWQETKRGRR